jgi:CBS domain-containing protein
VIDTIASVLKTKGSAIWRVAPHDSVYEAIVTMADKSVGALLVMEGNLLVGIISERDYARKVILQGRSSKDTTVSDIMTRSLITVTPAHTVDECMRLVTEYHIRHLPVLEGTEVAGVVSIGDLVRSIISAQAHTIDQLHTYIHGAAIVR